MRVFNQCKHHLMVSYKKMLEIYLETNVHQFGFKSPHATDVYVTVQSVVKYYTKHMLQL